MKRYTMNIQRLFVATLLLISPIVSQAQDAKAAAILDAMSKKYQSFSSFTAAFNYGSDAGVITTKGGKYHLKLAGQEVFNDGKTVATYVKEANEVNISSNDPASNEFSPANIYNIYKNGYTYKLVEAGKAGNAVIDLTPNKGKSSNVSKVRLTISQKDNTLKGWQITDKSGRVQHFKISKFTPNVAVADNQFTFNKARYPGVEVIDLRD
ncbi:outer membrane lipoprotein carrier protein LolA [Siphonobacter sp. SORGH_AS_1065]|uniref:LolA family protein n=1 Tax=Siphonobacter sp. SORGH_AS_1065 TaxID=3041795 RepID=UPI0027893440|nr:outer membrane lipoprotein carrier protein LolA [Siphonobacter sp. SORGH_AS_1065]MDQ1088238.1 outer membrane lipoprotein carrier protein [Siphonobacter sp. SORGH_AS_1065]